jgi:hypothetical protein
MGIDITRIFYESFWWIILAIVNISVIITQALKAKFNIKGVWQEVTAWIISSVLCVGGWFLNLISLGEPTWLSLVSLCFITSIATCGWYDIPAIKKFVNMLFSLKPKA